MIYSNGRAVNNNWTTCSCGDPEGVGGPDSLSLEKSFLLHSDSKITSTENRLQIPTLKKVFLEPPPQEFLFWIRRACRQNFNFYYQYNRYSYLLQL